MACDATYRFVNCVAKWPGSVHDSRVFKESSLARIFETSKYINSKINFFHKNKNLKG